MKTIITILVGVLAFMAGCALTWTISPKKCYTGMEISSDYIGDDAGFTQVTLYDHGICKVEIGGIFGITDSDLYGYYISDGKIVLQTEERIYNLEAMQIKFGDISYKLTSLPGK